MSPAVFITFHTPNSAAHGGFVRKWCKLLSVRNCSLVGDKIKCNCHKTKAVFLPTKCTVEISKRKCFSCLNSEL